MIYFFLCQDVVTIAEVELRIAEVRIKEHLICPHFTWGQFRQQLFIIFTKPCMEHVLLNKPNKIR